MPETQRSTKRGRDQETALPPSKRKEDRLDEEEYIAAVEAQLRQEEEEQAELKRLREERLRLFQSAVPEAHHAVVPVPLQQPRHSDNESEPEIDMFSASPVTDLFSKPLSAPTTSNRAVDSYDDAEGYLRFAPGTVLHDRFEVYGVQGRGVFSTVLKARDLLDGNRELVVKAIRNNSVMHKAGLAEVEILQKLNRADPEDTSHVVRLHSSFVFQKHLCLAFDPMESDLRVALEKKGDGVPLVTLRQYSRQLLGALAHLRKEGIIHCDLKPDNILVSSCSNTVCLCDFGSACALSDVAVTPLLVSRFYRAPEIMLGLQYDCAIDMWSLGCILYELYMHKVLFAGSDNNDMLLRQMLVLGPFPRKMLKKGQFVQEHFGKQFDFLRTTTDPLSKKEMREPTVAKKRRDLRSEIVARSGVMNEAQFKEVRDFAAFLHRCLELDPSLRIKPATALQHPFLLDGSDTIV